MKLLVVEDDPDTATFILKGFREHGHVVDHVVCGVDGLTYASSRSYCVLIVDRMILGLDGLSLVKALRAAKITTPAIFLSSLAGVDDRVEGLEAGGDDYLVKPFSFSELLARVNALARRPPVKMVSESVLLVGDLELNRIRRTVTRAAQEISIQPREFALLEYLMENAGRLVTRTMLLENVWGFHFDPKTNIVETHISRLRSKVDRGFDIELIRTMRGAGYMICAPDQNYTDDRSTSAAK